ncbi:ScbR family autoregulator-binding transcription factor [Streptomyces sp. NBC_00009]|uniref:ScbR family autoregulator-binding transcription factor n=1 Tax=Streptomyces sp. NBC_00009 TaxID=2975620 RepID=UPI0032536E18
MAIQDRAIRTRRTIVEAAAKVFEERGYQAATIAEILSVGKVTKGALYFHFDSKEALARGLLVEQDVASMAIPPRACKLQELVDTVAVQAYRLRTDAVVRAAVRLTMDHRAQGLDRGNAFMRWIEVLTEILEQAAQQSEVLPQVNPAETAELIVGAFAGVQAMSQALTGYQDVGERAEILLRHVLPSVAVSSVLASLDLSSDRGRRVANELETAPKLREQRLA